MCSSDGDPELPEDVIEEILKRLPVGSLLRFRCVSRSWRSAIDHRRFVALHLNRSALDASNLRTLCLGGRVPRQKVCSLIFYESHPRPSYSRLQLPFVAPRYSYCFAGSCNGLICVEEISPGFVGTMYLWNPFTRNHKVVRLPFLFVRRTSCFVVGFGFDAKSHDYKIVTIIYSQDDYRQCFAGTKPRVIIYSLRTDSWRTLKCDVPAVSFPEAGVYLNGNLHWLAPKLLGVGGYGSIVSFDVASEVFDEMPLPEEISQEDTYNVLMYVAVLNDLLAVFRGDAVYDKLYSICSVWVMREYGVPQSWTKLYTFKACGEVTTFHGFTRSGMLLLGIFPGKRFSQNPITGKFVKLPLSASCNFVNVVESLVHFRDDSVAATFTGNAD